MNRIAELVRDHKVSPKRSSLQAPFGQPSHSGNPGLSYCMVGPMDYEPNYAYPLIVWLHGPDDDERQINRVFPHISLKNYAGVSPRGPHQQLGMADAHKTYTWTQSPNDIVKSLDRVLDCIELAKSRFRIAPDRVFLAGYEAGGTMAVRLALTNPRHFAGAASFNGPFPRQQNLLRNLEQAREFPLMVAYGRDSVDYDTDCLMDDVRLIHVAGLRNLNIRQYPCGDDLVAQMLKDLNVWAMELVTGSRMESSSRYWSGEGCN